MPNFFGPHRTFRPEYVMILILVYHSFPNFIHCWESQRRSVFDQHKTCLYYINIQYINVLSITFRHYGKVYDPLTGIFLIPTDLDDCYDHPLAHRTSGASKCGKREQIVRHFHCLKSDK